MRRIAVITLVGALALPAAAGAQVTSPSPLTGATGVTGPAPKPPAKTKPKKKKARPPKVRIRLGGVDVQRLQKRRVVLAGQKLRVRGAVSKYYKGAKVIVQFVRDGDVAKATTRTVTRVKGSSKGEFFASYRPGSDGKIIVKSFHKGDRVMADSEALPITVTALQNRAGEGAKGLHVRWLQQQLFDLHYATPVDGVYRGSTARAVLSFRKMLGMERNGHAGPKVFAAAAAGRGAWDVRHPNAGKHVEANLSRQLLALINTRGRVYKIFTTSSGKSSTPTILGGFRFYSKQPGTNSHGMIHSSYFIRGYAIHGYHSVPTYPASHGCLRVPPPSARFIYDWIGIGDRIFVYY